MAAAGNPSIAAPTGTVSVSGTIVAVPASISITNGSISFGNIDAKGTPQSSQQAVGYLSDGGAYWVTVSAATITVSSPTAWNGTVCRSAAVDLPSGGLVIMSPDERPSGESDAASKFSVATRPGTDCATPTSWVSNGQPSSAATYNEHMGTFVLNGDAPRAFNVTVTFSVSNIS
jgi:hypothetical protein